jgi:competence protein ComEA
MHSVSPLNISPTPLSARALPIAAAILLCAATAHAQLPDGPGKAETERFCSQCHELARSISLHQDHGGWETTGATATSVELQNITDYLTVHFGAEEIPRINIDKCRAIDLESGLALKRSEAGAVIEYCDKHGAFQSIDDLKKGPNLDFAKMQANTNRLTFDKP